VIKAVEVHIDKLVGQHNMEVLHYEGYGKNQIKNYKTSLDVLQEGTTQ
jgi:carnitine O-acetyltransferase